MSVQLLDKTRKINKLLHNSSSSKVVFNDICQVLMDTLSSNILVLSKKGKVLGISLCPGVEEITELIEDNVGGHVDSLLNERFLGVLSTKENTRYFYIFFDFVRIFRKFIYLIFFRLLLYITASCLTADNLVSFFDHIASTNRAFFC